MIKDDQEYVMRLASFARLEGQFRTSVSNWDSVYLDGIKMLLMDPGFWRQYYKQRIGDLHPVATGRSGAVILGLIGRGTLCNLDKDHGTEWANYPELPYFTSVGSTKHTWPVLDQLGVALVDDCQFTGKTLLALRAACAKQGMAVKKEVVAWPFQPL